MDVSRINRASQAQPGKSSRNVNGGEGFSQLLDSRPAVSSSVGGSTAAGALDALLVVQEAGSATDRRAKARRRASDLLDGLDQIRSGLLAGQVSKERLESLSAMVAQQRDNTDDPNLESLLDDIELRVHVELAKLGQLPAGFF